jgi:N4-(beta-N-acetylglucosaminyl)-L-asparaginase
VRHGRPPAFAPAPWELLEGRDKIARVARLVMERTDRVFLVGAGARKFATAHGFPMEDLSGRRRDLDLLEERMSDIDDWEVWAASRTPT